MISTECGYCGTPLPRAGTGRPARYCSAAHRVAAHRARTAVPTELTTRDRWVRRSANKVPLQSGTGRNASSTNPRTWSSYKAAEKAPHGAGLGFVLNGDGIVCIDLDGCLSEGRLASWATEILNLCPRTFVEVSPSGNGLHIWGYGEVETGRVIRDGRKVEIYGRGRYICVTGKRFRGSTVKLADLSPVLAAL